MMEEGSSAGLRTGNFKGKWDERRIEDISCHNEVDCRACTSKEGRRHILVSGPEGNKSPDSLADWVWGEGLDSATCNGERQSNSVPDEDN